MHYSPMRAVNTLAIFAALCSAGTSTRADEKPTVHWPQFRGTHAAGVAEGFKTPTNWDVKTGENIRWKTPIPGLAHSSPAVWGDRIFVTTAVSDDPEPYLRVGLYGASPDHPEQIPHDYRVYCLDKRTGAIIWQQTAHRGIPKAQRHIKATHANCTPAVDGKHVVAFFGSEGLFCYDHEGKLLWKKDLGDLDSGAFNAHEIKWGFASSPVIHKGRVYVQCDVYNESFLAVYDVTDGREIRRIPRDDNPTWSTPALYEHDGRTQLIVNGYKHIGAYDASTGKEIWKLHGGGDIPVPTPIIAKELIFITNAHGGPAPIYAIRTSATGDITPEDGARSTSDIAWIRRAGAYMQTPLVYGDFFYCCRDNGVLSCLDLTTGKKHYRTRLAEGRTGFTASPVAADGKLYFTSEEGDIHVVAVGPELEVLAVNPMGEICMATPAISEGTLFFRTQHHLFAVGEKRPGS